MKANKKKVLFYGSLAEGGIGKVLVDLVNSLDKSKYEITVMDRFPKAYYCSAFEKWIKVKHNVPFKETASKTYNHLVRVICDRLPRSVVYRLFVHKKYDVEIACDDSFSARLIGGSNNKDSKKILWEHMDVTKDISTPTYFDDNQIKEYFEPFDLFVGVSKECMEKFAEKYGFKERLMYIYNPINSISIEKQSKEKCETLFEKNDFRIVALGRLMPQKAFLRLVDVCAKLKNEGLKFELLILGEGPERQAIEEKIDKYDLKDYVKLGGFRTNPYPYIKQADLLLCASIHESYCLSVAESIVLETPVMSTKCVGPNELLNYGEYGILVENNELALFDGLKKILRNPNLLDVYRTKLKERKAFFSMEECVYKWEELLDGRLI